MLGWDLRLQRRAPLLRPVSRWQRLRTGRLEPRRLPRRLLLSAGRRLLHPLRRGLLLDAGRRQQPVLDAVRAGHVLGRRRHGVLELRGGKVHAHFRLHILHQLRARLLSAEPGRVGVPELRGGLVPGLRGRNVLRVLPRGKNVLGRCVFVLALQRGELRGADWVAELRALPRGLRPVG